jgi:hypothetical protein
MAHTDYSARALALPFCPTARLASAVDALDSTVTMVGYTSPIAEGIRIGMAAMIEDEIVVVEARAGNVLTIGRGTCDTVPAAHPANATIFFFDDSLGSDDRQYVATESVGVKPLPRTNSGGPVPIEASPAEGLTFNWRFHRPYPPGNVLVNGQPFTEGVVLESGTEMLTLTWAHRDRLLQQDQLVAHEEPSIGPEAGTSYRVRVYDDANVLKRTENITSGTTWTYARADALIDLGATSTVARTGRIELESRRDDFASWQRYSIALEARPSVAPAGVTLSLNGSVGDIVLRSAASQMAFFSDFTGSRAPLSTGSNDWDMANLPALHTLSPGGETLTPTQPQWAVRSADFFGTGRSISDVVLAEVQYRNTVAADIWIGVTTNGTPYAVAPAPAILPFDPDSANGAQYFVLINPTTGEIRTSVDIPSSIDPLVPGDVLGFEFDNYGSGSPVIECDIVVYKNGTEVFRRLMPYSCFGALGRGEIAVVVTKAPTGPA